MGIILLQHTLQDADTTIITFNTLTSGLIQAVGKKKQLDCTWLCAAISLSG